MPPFIKKGFDSDSISHSIKFSHLWNHFEKIELPVKENMRVLAAFKLGNNQNAERYIP